MTDTKKPETPKKYFYLTAKEWIVILFLMSLVAFFGIFMTYRRVGKYHHGGNTLSPVRGMSQGGSNPSMGFRFY
jgi:hypothetical protein